MLEKYSKYRDSGVEWLGEIPDHWEVKRLKNIAHINKESLPEWTNRKLKIQYVDIGSVEFERGVTKIETFEFRNAPSRARRLADRGDTIISTVRTYLKAIDFIDENKSNYVYSTGFAVLKPLLIIPRFLSIAVKSDSFTNQVDALSTGMSYPAINSTTLGQISLAIPSLQEQTSIARFLDQKTAQIDKAIIIKEKQIALLKERRQILIHQAVTRGLNKEVEMKNSGVEWIGEIPKHWEVKANRVLFIERNEPGREELPLLSISIHTAISSEELDENENIRGKVRIEDKHNYKLVKPNDIAFNMMRAWQGAIGVVSVEGMVSPAYVVVRPIELLNSKYLEYQFRTSAYIGEMNRASKGITDFRKRLYWHEFKQLITIIPPFDEQQKITIYIEKVNAKIELAISLKEQEIEKLKEYRSTLIDSVVMGKIKVS